MVKLRHQIITGNRISTTNHPVDCLISRDLVSYEEAVAVMENRVCLIAENRAPELIWLLEHPSLYTAGTSAENTDLLSPERFNVYRSGRGGQFTYHGPGQRIAYVMLNLKLRRPDVRLFIAQLEEVLIRTLTVFGIKGERREDRVGVWVKRSDKSIASEDKIAAMGLRLRKWVTFHGLSLNVNPNLEHFSGIVPCGVHDHGTTSLHDLGALVSMDQVDQVLMDEFSKEFGSPLTLVPALT